MIPKVIHYCWFGGNKKPELVEKCIKSWKAMCPDYRIVEWNEENYDINKCAYIHEAYENKKWAFVADYARLDIVYHEGGIYLDTDIELLRSLDDLLANKAYFGFEDGNLINTGVGFGAEKGSDIVYAMLRDYNGVHFVKDDGKFDVTPCPVRNSHALLDVGFELNGITQEKDGIKIYSEEWFCPINYHTGEQKITDNTVSIHHYSGLWMSEEERQIIEMERKLKKILGEKPAFWVRCRMYSLLNLKTRVCGRVSK